MVKYFDSYGKLISLTKMRATSGEGEVWETSQSEYLAKIYHKPDQERSNKLQVMLANLPENPTRSQNHISIAWPQGILKDSSGNCIGFLMPDIRQAKELLNVYNPKYRLKNAPNFNWFYLHATAYNLCLIIQALHNKGHVIGDMKPQNLLVNDRGLVSIIDTDSFQVKDPKNGKIYRCTVGTESFTPPELIGKQLLSLTQNQYHDRFRLAIIIHLLLFGYHPFQHGKWVGSGNQPEPEERIYNGLWIYKQNSLFESTETSIPLDIVHPEIKKLFLRCFNDGHTSLISRPSARDWCNTLEVAIADLIPCSHNLNHSYSKVYGKCYWCDRASNLNGIDIFPQVINSIVLPYKQIHSLKTNNVASNLFFINYYLNLYNKTSNKTIKAAYVYWHEQRWCSKGWYLIEPGEVVQIDLGANYTKQVYIYGESEPYTLTQRAKQKEFLVSLISSFCIRNADQAIEILGISKKVSMVEYLISPGINHWNFSDSDLLNQKTTYNNTPSILQNPVKFLAIIAVIIILVVMVEVNWAIREFTGTTNNNEQKQIANSQTSHIPQEGSRNSIHKDATDNGTIYFNLASEYYESQNYDEAISYYTKALENNYNHKVIYPYLTQAYYYQGLNKSNSGEYQVAIQSFNQAIELSSFNAIAYYERCKAYQNLEKYGEALADCSQAILFNSNHPHYYNQRGFIYYLEGKNIAAIDDYDKAIKIDSEQPNFYTNRAMAYEQLGNIDEAINDFQISADLYLEQKNTEEYEKRIKKLQFLHLQLKNENQISELQLTDPLKTIKSQSGKFPIIAESNGVIFYVQSTLYVSDKLLLKVNLQNKSNSPVRFQYAFLDVTDDQGRSLSASTEGLPTELPANSPIFSGTIAIPRVLINDSEKISLALTDYPHQKLSLKFWVFL